MPTSKVIHSTAQKFLEIHDIANDLLILKDGATALIITVNAMNFGLLAEEEQDAIIYSYAGLLNSLNYPIQIVIKSQTKDVTSYLKLLDDELAVATSQTKRDWITRYRTFVANLIRERNVLDKKFYVVIPANAIEMGLMPPSTVIPGVQQPDLSNVERSVILQKAKEILEPKRDHLMAQFGRIGLIARQLTTQEIIQLFYLSYNPEAAEGQQITDTNSYTTPLVRASIIKGGNMMDSSQLSSNMPQTGSPDLVAPSSSPAAQSTSGNVAPPMGTTPPPISPPNPALTTTPIADLASASHAANLTAPVNPAMNVEAVTMPTTPAVNTLNSTSGAIDVDDIQNEIDSAASQVAPEPTSAPVSPAMAPSPTPAPAIPSPVVTPTPVPTPIPTPAPAAVTAPPTPAVIPESMSMPEATANT